MSKKNKNQEVYNIETQESLEQIEEDILEAANKTGKKNVIVNIFAAPHKKLKRRWKIRYKFNKKHLVMDVLFALGILVLIGLNVFWFWGGFHYFFNKLDLNVELSNSEVVSGSESSFVVKYNNRNKFELEDVVLSFEFPQYFEVSEISRSDYDWEHNILKLGDLAPGANGQFEVKGRVLGALHEEQAIYVAANFYKTNKKGDRLWGTFRRGALFEYEIKSSLLKLEADLPERLVNNQVFDWPIKITNVSQDITYEKLIINPNFNEYFIEFEGENRELLNFKPGEVAEFVVKAKIKTEASKRKIGVVVDWEKAGWVFRQAEWEKEQLIVDPKFMVTHQVQTQGAVDPGDWVDLKVTYLNAGEFSLENVELSLDLMGGYWDIYNVKKDYGQIQKTKVIWTKDDLPRLELLQPGEGGELSLSVKTKTYVAGSSEINLRTQSGTTYKFNEQNVEILDEVKTTKLNSNLAVSVYPMYYAATGDQLGRGPLPPTVGEMTKYWVFVKVINDISAVDNVKISMDLPLNVAWNDRSSVPVGNPLQFDDSTRTISWEISKVPVKPGNIGFAFEVSLVPSANQVGKYPVLVQNIRVEGQDSNTGERIEKDLGLITSQLSYDNKGKIRDGVVR